MSQYGLLGSVELRINGVQIPDLLIEIFEWASVLNGGYLVQGTVTDVNYVLLERIASGDGKGQLLNYLREARQKPVEVEWKIAQIGTSEKTELRRGYLLNLHAQGAGPMGSFSFVAQDPPTFFLNAGVAAGKVYRGKIGGKKGVIAQCVEDYTKVGGKQTISVDVTDTNDAEHGIWPMFRMDPKTYIMSLLDWSSNLTKDKESRWIVASKDTKINIKKASDFQGIDLGIFNITTPGYDDIIQWTADLNNYMTLYQGKLVTCGISATTGADVIRSVGDEETSKKVNVFKSGEGQDRAFTKPKGDGWPVDLPATFIRAVPEHSGGEVARKYADYMDGRARQIFDDMLTNVMRMRIMVPGSGKMDNSELLGVSTCTINWPRPDVADHPYFAHGKWIVDGFHHILKRSGGQSGLWRTYLDLYRIDWDAKAVELQVK
jgi:hypothetical protein